MPIRVYPTYINSEGEFIPTHQVTEELPPNISNPNDSTSQSSSQGTVTNSQNSSSTNTVIIANNAGVNATYGNQTASSNLSSNSYVPVGVGGSTGSINAISTKITSDDKFPNIFLNFRKNTFDNRSLIFKLDTDSLSSVAKGTLSNTWTDNSGISNLVLTGESANSLQCVEAYGLKFYELLSNKFITNASYAMSPTTFPTYTIFVFALARQELNKLSLLFNSYTNYIHKFVKSDSSFANIDLINLSQPQQANLARFSLNASTLSDTKYLINTRERPSSELNYLLTTNKLFTNNYPIFTDDSAFRSSKTLYELIKLFNLYNLPTLADVNAGTAVAIDNGSITNFNTFSLFFVEMHTYIDNGIAVTNQQPYYDLKYETFINRIPVYSSTLAFNRNVILPSSENYKISISNSSYNNTPSKANMFLFDYLQGQAQTKEEMQQKSKNIIESLAYKYRNLLLKSTSDLQIVNSTSSLKFPTDLCHPFVNFYARSSS